MDDKTMSLKTQRIATLTQQIDAHALKIADYQQQMVRLQMKRPYSTHSTADNPFIHVLTLADEMTQLFKLLSAEQDHLRRLVTQLMLDLGMTAEFNALHHSKRMF